MFKQLIVSILSIFIGVLFTAYYNSNSKIEYKDSVKEQYLNISNKAFNNLKVLYNDKKIDNLSIYQITIYNKTWNEYKDVNLYFTLKMKNGKKIPNIINKDFFAPTNQPSKIGISEFIKVDANTYKVNLKVLKRTGTDKYYLGRIIFEGNKIPEITISTPLNIGLEVVEYSYITEWTILIILIIGLILFSGIIMSIMIDFDTNRDWKKKVSRFEKVLSKTKSIRKEDISEIIENYTDEFKLKDGYCYKKTLSILRSLKLIKSEHNTIEY